MKRGGNGGVGRRRHFLERLATGKGANRGGETKKNVG